MALAARGETKDGHAAGEPAVLVIDPNEEHQALSTMALGRRGFRVTIAGTAREGMQLALSQPFAAIVLDLKLRDMPALEVLGVLAHRLPEVPKIFVVASGQEPTAVRALASGASGYLVKTARYNELLPSEVETQIRAAAARRSLKQQKKALGESEDRFQKVFRASPVAIALATRTEGRFFDVNDAFLGLLGYTREEIIGRTATELGLYVQDAAFEALQAKVLGKGPVRDHEAHFRAKSGEVRTVSVSVESIELEGSPCLITLARDVTEERRALAAREADSRRFQAMIEHISDGISMVDADGRVTWQSSSAYRMFGYGPDEIIGKSGFEFMHPDDALQLAPVFADLLSTPGKSVTAEFRIRHGNGTWRWMEVVGTNLLSDPDLHAVVVNYRDITDRNEALEHIRFQASLLSQVRNAVIATDKDQRIVYWNEAATAMYGWRSAEAIGRFIRQVLPTPGSRPTADSLIEQAGKVGHWEGERLMARKDGSRFPADVSITALRDRNGALIGYVGVSTDVTERAEARRDLEMRARQQAEIAALGQKALVEPLVSTLLNEAVRALARTLDMEYASILELVPGQDAFVLKAKLGWDLPTGTRVAEDPHATMAASAISTHAPVVTEDAEQEPRLEVRELFVRRGIVSGVSVVIPGPLRPYGVLCVHSKERRHFTKDDVHFCESIANVIANALERNRIEKILAENERMASMGQLAAYVAHEVNTPLTNISLLASSIARREKDPQLLQKVAAIGEQRRKATAIITEILEFPRERSSRRAPEDLRKVIAAAVEQVAPYRKPEVKLVLDTGEHSVVANIDVIQIRDVFTYLLKNALEATAQGQVNVALRELPDYILISVSDSGTGIAPDALEQLFHPLSTLKSPVEGATFGLALSRNIVAAHGGKIEATSEVGKGSTFTVILPRFEAR